MKSTKSQVLGVPVDALAIVVEVWSVEDGRKFSVHPRGDGSYLFDSRVNEDGIFPSFTKEEVIAQFTIPVTARPMSKNHPPTRWLVEPDLERRST